MRYTSEYRALITRYLPRCTGIERSSIRCVIVSRSSKCKFLRRIYGLIITCYRFIPIFDSAVP